jgi:GntR family transcriptional regulator/MocR family aminotransferase
VARALLNPGDAVWVEDPGYPGSRAPLLAVGASLVPVPVNHEGLEVEVGQRLNAQARMAIITPSHQFPTAVTMSLSRRLELLAWSREARAWIVEDDYDSEYRFSGRPLEALQGLDPAERVIYVGTFSKVLFPALRLGYLVLPPRLLKDFLIIRSYIDRHLPLLEQMALTDFINEGYFARYLRRMRLRYLERRNALVDALSKEVVPGLLEVTLPEAGLHLVAWLPVGMDAQSVVRLAAESGLRMQFLSRFGLQTSYSRDGLVLGFAGASPAQLRAGVKALARILRILQSTAHKA